MQLLINIYFNLENYTKRFFPSLKLKSFTFYYNYDIIYIQKEVPMPKLFYISIIFSSIIFIFFCVLIIMLIVKSFKKKKTEHDTNYVVNDIKPENNQDSSTITYYDSNYTPANLPKKAFASAIYLCIFSTLWIGILIFIIIMSFSISTGYMQVAFIPFILVAILLIIKTIQAFIVAFKIKNNSNQLMIKNNSIEKPKEIKNEYFVKMCVNCGAELRPNDKFCPECGKEIK